MHYRFQITESGPRSLELCIDINYPYRGYLSYIYKSTNKVGQTISQGLCQQLLGLFLTCGLSHLAIPAA